MESFIADVMSGVTDIEAFITRFCRDAQFREEVDLLLPREAIGNREHEIWRRYSYDAYAACGFSCSKHICELCKFDHSIGDNLNIFSIVQVLFSYRYPNIICTTKYIDLHDLYLDVVKDCFDGPEVSPLVNEIICSAAGRPTKTARKRIAYELIKSSFHIDGNIRPRWIQGPEWPMGVKSPMKYINKKSNGEEVRFEFVDVDTGIKRIVIQYY